MPDLKRLTFLLSLLLFFSFSNAQNHIPCITDHYIEQQIAKDPSLIEKYQQLQARADEIAAGRQQGNSFNRNPRVIPVVFHVIHQGGSENISDAQILDQMRILNEDYSRTNADTADTRPIFKPVAANPNIEFRLAQKDPQGNCTDGIVRIFSDLTTNATDAVKALSWWDNTKYLNVWVVQTIDNGSGGGQGTVLGYAQLPGFGAPETDGVVIRSDFCGSIETAAIQNGMGRTLTHEVGHWLGLLHPFQGGCSGGTFGETVEDTPPVAQASFGCNHNANTCNNDNPDLPDQVENFMDYANGSCQNMFTLGQKAIMDATLNGSRSNIITQANLTATGTDGTPAQDCAPKAEFYATTTMDCEGENFDFIDGSYNGDVTNWEWEFDGGNPATSSDSAPTVQFNSVGFHDVTLTVSNAQGSDSKTKSSYVYVTQSDAAISNWQHYEGFEEDNIDNNRWLPLNHANVGSTWQQSSSASYSGGKCIMINLHSGNTAGAKDDLILPPIDLTQINSPQMTFKVAHAQRPGSFFEDDSNDRLRVYASTTCGASWAMRFNKSGENLATVNQQSSSFTPAGPGDWEEHTVSLASFTNIDHVLVKFETTSDAGNNIYIDDIRISGPTGVAEETAVQTLNVYPNPAREEAVLNFKLNSSETVELTLTDITGRIVSRIYTGNLPGGEQTFRIKRQDAGGAGLYLLQLETENKTTVRKLIFH